jgi:HemY protein
MFRALWFAVKVAVIAAAALWISKRPGAVEINWLGYDVTAQIGFVFACLLVFVLVLLVLHRAFLALMSLPQRWRRYRERERQAKGYRALTRGLSAAAAGDAKHAVVFAGRARKYWPNDKALAVFLEAQAARLRGDKDKAEQSFRRLLENRDTAFLGLRGLISAALEDGQTERALVFARQALKLHAKQPWLLRTVYELELQVRDWDGAEATLKSAVRYKAVTGEKARGDRIAMLLYRADKAAARGAEGPALKALTDAAKLNPGFVPAAERLAAAYIRQGRRRKAISVIEKAWKQNPHPSLAALWEKIAPENKPSDPAVRLRWFEKLVALRPDSMESQLAAARAALDSGLWGEAQQYLNMAGTLGDSARLCRMRARLAEKRGHPAEAARWLEQAADAPGGEVWYCAQTGRLYENWSPIAQPHGAFNTIRWGRPQARPGDSRPDAVLPLLADGFLPAA